MKSEISFAILYIILIVAYTTIFKKAKQQTWYDSTVFILVADHGCRYPLQRNNYEVERHHIPLVIVGGALKEEYRNKINAKFASHTDLATTLLAQLNISSNEFIRSKNIFNPNSPAFAYYAFDNGFGLISKDRKVIYDHYKRKLILGNESDTAIFQFVNYGKAYLQCTNGFTAAQQLK
ncbi:MAG: sulfatase-like hydrolase/transferase [Bacteroidetes bacterium]|nr:sulfatase-like hydrolase/transferase [Bacteroidota bacterium]